jgi:hypothetical protein
MSEALDTIYQDGEDCGYNDYIQNAKDELQGAFERMRDEATDPGETVPEQRKTILTKALENYFYSSRLKGMVASIIEEMEGEWDEPDTAKQTAKAFECISDWIGDGYENDGCARMDYEGDGYQLHTDSYGDVWVMKSQFFTYAQFCSPCAPGACSLTNPLEFDGEKPSEKFQEDNWSNRAYCLGHDWYDDDQAPYPVFSVETGKRVISLKVNVTCPNCNGTGKDNLQRLADIRQCSVVEVISSSEKNGQTFAGLDAMTHEFTCFRCDGKGTKQETQIGEI